MILLTARNLPSASMSVRKALGNNQSELYSFVNKYDGDMAVSRNKCNSQLIFLSMLITKLGIPASETSLPLGV